MDSNRTTYNSSLKKLTLTGLLVTMGIVFGDIGTSPLYVMKAITGVNREWNNEYIIGAISCVIWTLTLQTTVKYVLIALHADNDGEGGILALFALLRRVPRRWLYIVAATGAAALVADGVITPAITVTSAIEGLEIIVPSLPTVPIAAAIILLIFVMQQMGTGKIGRCFGPFMLAWFSMLGVLGALQLITYLPILKAFNPWYAVKLLIHYPEWFLILGAVFLCTTGAEALYSDLGHCGRKNIAVSWIFVKIMLILNYLGQGAWLIIHPQTAHTGINPFYALMPGWFTPIGIIMSTGAAIIASQALLSGSFTIFSEAVNLDFWPKLKIKYPTTEKGQLYIPAVNWCLLAGCLMTLVIFQDSGHMEAAYGLAITITMLMTTVLLTFWLRTRGASKLICALFLLSFSSLEGVFFIANLFKFTHGGWFSILIAGIVASIMIIWYNAIKVRRSFVTYNELKNYTETISAMKNDSEIPKYASNLIFFSRAPQKELIESKIIYSIINKQPKRADHYWFLHIQFTDAPDTLEYSVDIPVEQTIYVVTMRLGFRTPPKVSVYLRQIVEDLVAEHKLDLTSSYPSLRRERIAGDFRFLILQRIFSASSNCTRRKAMLMRLYETFRHMGVPDQSALGLDTSVVTCETVPLIINTNPSRRITHIQK